MRFISLVKSIEGMAGMPPKAFLDAMDQLVQEAGKAGCVMVEGVGLHPTSAGARVRLSEGKVSVTDGPFTESKELIAGFWIVQAGSKEEAVERARRVPLKTGRIEVREIYDVSEFDQNNEFVQKELKWREQTGESRTA